MAIAVPTRTRLVRAAMANDRCSGEPKYSSEYLCSVVSACEKPSRSAASACSRTSPSTACGSPVTSPWVNSTPMDMGSPRGSDRLRVEVHQRDAGVEHAGHPVVQDAAVIAGIVGAAGGGRAGHPAQRQRPADVDPAQVGDRVEAADAVAG